MKLAVKPVTVIAIVLLSSPLILWMDGFRIANAEDQWLEWARIAWEYFEPGIGVNPSTGLHYATSGWHRFTDWDLGVYIQAVIDAEKLGILARDDTWGANYRLEKVLSFLESRQLSADGLPYAQYSADSGSVPGDIGGGTSTPSDSGKLLLALDDLRAYRPDLTTRINSLVGRHNFQKFADGKYFSDSDIYPWYVAQGYSAFGYSTPQLGAVESLGNGSFVDVYGLSLPKAWVTSEPLVSAILENRSGGLYRTYADRVFTAQQRRYEATGKLTAFSEGSYLAPQYYVYEWIVTTYGETWVVYANGKIDTVPLAYSKIAFAFHAIYDNQYTSVLVNELSPIHSTQGFYEGRTEEGARLEILSDKTNGMILAAARYRRSFPTTTTSTSTTTEISVTTSTLQTSATTSLETTSFVTTETTSFLTTETTMSSLSSGTSPTATSTLSTWTTDTLTTQETTSGTSTALSTTTPMTASSAMTETSTTTTQTTSEGSTIEYPSPPGCLVATAAYGSEMAPEVTYMRHVRDELIGSTATGKILRDAFNVFYYAWSPTVAEIIEAYEPLRVFSRILLLPLVGTVHFAAVAFELLGGGDIASLICFLLAAGLVITIYVAAPILLLGSAVARTTRYLQHRKGNDMLG